MRRALNADAVQQLREQIAAAARAYAEEAGALIPEPAAMGQKMRASLTHAIEVRVTEAMAIATEETLSGFVTQKGRIFAELSKALDMDEERASKALDNLTQQIGAY